MGSWMEYICDVINDGGLSRVCIVQKARTQWIASHGDFMLNDSDISDIYKLYEEGVTNVQVKFKNHWFRLVANDDVSLHLEDDEQTEIIIVAKTNHFLIAGSHYLQSEDTKDICKIEVDYIQHIIKGQGK